LHLDSQDPQLLLSQPSSKWSQLCCLHYRYVIIISLDFSKAFDTVRRAMLLQKFAQMDIPDAVYNWLVDYFASH